LDLIEKQRETFKEPQVHLFSSDSGSETSCQSTISTKSKDTVSDCSNKVEKVDYDNFSKLFVKQTPVIEPEPEKLISTNLIADYSSFVKKLNLKRKLHK
jgi:hypothetical protein